MAKTVGDIFGVRPPTILDAGPFYATMQPGPEVIDCDRAIGIEVEVENAGYKHNPQQVWMNKADGSLRNAGVEWITHPIEAKHAPNALQDLLGNSLAESCCFSPRTSIHVHVNCQGMTGTQVTDILMLYTILEPLFYKYTGRGRIKNIYCVPLMDTMLTTGMGRENLGAVVETWSKYAGLNIIPLGEFGTIEFRHMHGTFNHNKVVIWIRIINKLIDYVLKVGTPSIRRLAIECNAFTNWRELLHDIFGNDDIRLKFESFEDIRRSSGVVKRSFIDRNKLITLIKSVSKESPYFKTIGA
jgi:hypothetical protein